MDKRQYHRLMAAVVIAVSLVLLALWHLWIKIDKPAQTQVNNYVGKSAYQSAIDTGFKGTELEWVKSLQSVVQQPKDGNDGKNGTDGKNGVDGKQIVESTQTVVTLPGKDGVDGQNGREIQFRTNPDTKDKEWRYSGTRLWNVLIAYCEIKDTCEAENDN